MGLPKMLIFKLTALESLVLLLNPPGHLRVRMTSAHQAGVLKLIFKEKSRGLWVVKKKAAQTIGRIERFAENKRDWCGIEQARENISGKGWDGLWQMKNTLDMENRKAKGTPLILRKLFHEELLTTRNSYFILLGSWIAKRAGWPQGCQLFSEPWSGIKTPMYRNEGEQELWDHS